jgi:aryl-alcohol dehydrogenase-like predicted oxidoreductase
MEYVNLGNTFWDTANVYSGGDSEIAIGRFRIG